MSPITQSLLIRYFKGHCNEEEGAAVQAFITAETNPALVDAAILEAFDAQAPEQLIPLSENEYHDAWQQFRQKSGWQPAVLPPAKRIHLLNWLRYTAAAVLILVASVAGWQITRHKTNDRATLANAALQRIQAGKGAPRRITLTDGSTVYLFPGSELLIPGTFNEKARSVQLKGRAFFDVAQHAEKPFLVQTGEISARVLGTSFEINGSRYQQVAVTVRTGMVGVHDSKHELARLRSNQQILYQTNSGAFAVNPADAAGLCNWISGELVFDRTPLAEVCRTLELWYGVTIELDAGKWKHKRISVKFRQQPLSTVLEVLSLSSGFKYEKQNNHIKII